MEASAMNLPCITTNNAGNSEVIIDGYSGIVLNNKDAINITKSISFLIENPKQRNKFGINSRKHILKNFNLDNQISELISTYNLYLNN